MQNQQERIEASEEDVRMPGNLEERYKTQQCREMIINSIKSTFYSSLSSIQSQQYQDRQSGVMQLQMSAPIWMIADRLACGLFVRIGAGELLVRKVLGMQRAVGLRNLSLRTGKAKRRKTMKKSRMLMFSQFLLQVAS